MQLRILLSACTIMVYSCTPGYVIRDRNNDNLISLKMGMSSEQVLAVMGKPDIHEAYANLNDHNVVIYFYQVRQLDPGNTLKNECVPVVIEDNKLVGWGDEFYRSVLEIIIHNR